LIFERKKVPVPVPVLEIGLWLWFQGTSLNWCLIAGYCWFQTFSPEIKTKFSFEVSVPKSDPIKNLLLVPSH
jgi:hypothetical protein